MGRVGRSRSCYCLLCGEAGKLVEDHDWKEHTRQIRLEKKRLTDQKEALGNSGQEDAQNNPVPRLVFGLAVNNELAHTQSNFYSPLWRDPQECKETTKSSDTTGTDFDLEELVFALADSPSIPSQPRDIRVIFREKRNAIQRKMDRALAHISHSRNMKKLKTTHLALTSLEARFKLETQQTRERPAIEELESLLASLSLETNAVKGRTIPVKEFRDEINEGIDDLSDKLLKWRLEHDEVLPVKQPTTFQMGKVVY